jgi:hypothetical protein
VPSEGQHISGVPVTIVNEETEILGALPEDAFVSQTLGTFTRDNSPSAQLTMYRSPREIE